MLEDLVKRNRSYRRFYQEVSVPHDVLKGFIELARLTPSAANRQPLKYLLVNDRDKNEKLFKSLNWAAYLTDWDGPEEGEKPSAYIIVLGDTEIAREYYDDPGIAMQTILLGAVEKGFGGCMLASVKRENIRKDFSIPDRFEILYVVALGKPKEKVVIENVTDNNIKYWRDSESVHHVPKRGIDELLSLE